MIVVIGSGPAAVAATHALVQQGHEVTVLDVGTTLEPDRQQIVDRMAALEPSEWTMEDRGKIEGTRSSDLEAVHSKQSFGSSYAFAPSTPAMDVRWASRRGFRHSFAIGGLSNVWGAVLLPYRQEDLTGWPISVEDLAPHYRAVMDFVPGTAMADGLEEVLPSYSGKSEPLTPSRQGMALLEDLEKQKLCLRDRGIHFGRSRLAIKASGDETRPSCRHCRLCLSGCPYGLIYSSAQTLAALIRTGKVIYKKDHLVEKLEDLGDKVLVNGRNPADGRTFQFSATRVLLGSGVLPTARIILESLKSFDRPVELKDSQYFIYPMLRFARNGNVEQENAHTSSQVFLEIDDPAVSRHLVHLQIYGFSTFLLRELNRTFLRWPLRIPGFRRHFLDRLLIVQGFLHSAESGTIGLTLKRSSDGGTALHALTKRSRRTLAATLKVGWKLMGQALKMRALPLVPGLKMPIPGSGYHSGGSFPMAVDPSELETDTLGRLPSMPRVHLVDASVFPSIPATSITFSVMANAHRIATAAGRLDTP